MKKLKIGFFIDTFFPMIDGVIMVVDNYAKRLSKIADVTVFCPYQKDKTFEDNFSYKVVRCKSVRMPGSDYCCGIPKMDSKFKKAVKNANLDLVHIHSPFGVGKIGVNYAKKHNIPCIATLHSQYKQDFYKATHLKGLTNILLNIAMSTFNKCDICWGVNSEIASLYKNEYRLKAPASVQNNGTELTLFENKSEAEEFVNAKFNILPDEHVLLFVGRIIELKNVFFIADSLEKVKKSGIKFKMLYVGSGPDEHRLKEHVEKLGLTDNVIFCGKITDREEMCKIYRRADIFLFPSLYDASSLVQIEAASQKTVSLFIKGAKTAGTITENVNGFLSENSVDSFADKIIEILSDENLLNTISENAYRDLYLSWDKAVENAYNDYLKIIEEKKV